MELILKNCSGTKNDTSFFVVYSIWFIGNGHSIAIQRCLNACSNITVKYKDAHGNLTDMVTMYILYCGMVTMHILYCGCYERRSERRVNHWTSAKTCITDVLHFPLERRHDKMYNPILLH